jgi:hypothetical protein
MLCALNFQCWISVPMLNYPSSLLCHGCPFSVGSD